MSKKTSAGLVAFCKECLAAKLGMYTARLAGCAPSLC